MSRLTINNLSFCETVLSTTEVSGGFESSFLFPLTGWSFSADFDRYYSNWLCNKKIGASSYTFSDKANNARNEKVSGILADGTHYSLSYSMSV